MPIWVAAVIWVGMAWAVPKRLPAHELYAICTFSCSFAFIFDLIFGAGQLDLYDYGVSGKIDVPDLAQVAVINPALAVLILNFMPQRMGWRLLYLGGWTVVLLLHELLWVKLGVMRYKGWSIWWSLASYPVIYLTLILNLKFYRHLVAKAVKSL